jgi:hypothetical protein
MVARAPEAIMNLTVGEATEDADRRDQSLIERETRRCKNPRNGTVIETDMAIDSLYGSRHPESTQEHGTRSSSRMERPSSKPDRVFQQGYRSNFNRDTDDQSSARGQQSIEVPDHEIDHGRRRKVFEHFQTGHACERCVLQVACAADQTDLVSTLKLPPSIRKATRLEEDVTATKLPRDR